jgi:voltage-gated sodium channel
VHVVRIYFCILLIGGGIIGMSFINSIFVDAMAADNNDDIKAQLSRMEAKLDEMARRQDKTEE